MKTTLTDLTLSEKNKMIAEFMGERTECPNNIEAERWQVKLTSPDGKVGLWPFGFLPPFHASWDWIMPVVEKIEAMGNLVKGVLIDGSRVQIWTAKSVTSTIDSMAQTKIEATYNAVIEFISWYNTHRL